MSWRATVECLASRNIACAVDNIRQIIKASMSSIHDAYFHAMDMIATGTAMLMDDIADFGKTDRPHHWMWGLILAVAGALLVAVILFFLIFHSWSS